VRFWYQRNSKGRRDSAVNIGHQPPDYTRGEVMPNRLGARIRTRRQQKGWTLQDLADASRLSVPYLSDLERREGVNPTLETLEALAGALQCSVADLVGQDGNSTVVPPPSLARFLRSDDFRQEVQLVAELTKKPVKDVEVELQNFLAVAPRRSTGDLSPTDWRRLLDVFRMIKAER
jgi:transcriptional regulator with XRE-family HTH domain